MQQLYKKIKSKYPDAVVMIRVDDFYITYEKDAEVLKQTCNFNKSFNANQFDSVLNRIIKAGYKVAICDPLHITN